MSERTTTMHIVKAIGIVAKGERGATINLYRGAPVPAGQDPEWVKQMLEEGLIVEVSVADAPAEDGEPEATGGKPAANASTEEWRAFALANGKTEADLDGLGRDAIRDLFPDA